MTHKYGDVYFVVLLYHTFSLFLLSPKPVSVLLDHCGLSHRSFPLLSLLYGKPTFHPLQIMSSFPMITNYSQKVTHLSLINQHEQCWVQMVFWPKQQMCPQEFLNWHEIKAWDLTYRLLEFFSFSEHSSSLAIESCIRSIILVLVWEIRTTLKSEKVDFVSSFESFDSKV